MIAMRRRLACCSRDREISIDFDEQERSMTTYNGLASCILNNQSYENESGTSRGDGCLSDFFDDDNSTCSSSKEGFGSFSSKWFVKKKDEQSSDDSEPPESPHPFHVKENRPNAVQSSDVEAMKEKFAKLLLGEDITGGTKGVSTALALSNAITNLAASVFGELWKLEPLPEERKNKWRREMDWLLLPTNYMVELVPAKQNGINGGTMEIMTPKARADIQMNLPALQKLDSMLIETLDSMVNTEFWYSEVGSRAEGRTKSANQCKRWWLPLPQVPTSGLSDTARKKLFHHSNRVYQVFKAAKSINENVLSEMPVPSIIRDAIPKSGRANLSDELLKVLTTDLMTTEEMLNNLDLKSEQSALEAINKLKAAIFVWKERIAAQASGKSPVRKSWSFIKDTMSELEKTESLLDKAEALVYSLKTRYPNLPQTFLDSTKIQYGKDVGHSILEAYSRVLGNLAFSILSRINDIFQEDASSNPSSPVAAADRCFQGMNVLTNLETLVHIPQSQHPLADDMSKVDEKRRESIASNNSGSEFSFNSVNATPSRGGRVWCIGREACIGVSP